MVATLIIYFSDSLKLAFIDLTKKDYDFLKKINGKTLNVDSLSEEEENAFWAIDFGFSTENFKDISLDESDKVLHDLAVFWHKRFEKYLVTDGLDICQIQPIRVISCHWAQ
jgi:hypothetical protein